MKIKYLYVSFDDSRGKYLYEHPNFKVRRGNVVVVETVAGETTAIVTKIAKCSNNTLPYKGKLRSVVKIVKDKDLKDFKKKPSGKVEKHWKYIKGFRKYRNGKYSVDYTYKNSVKVATFYLKSDNSWIIDFKVKNSGLYSANGIGKIELKNKPCQVKVLVKNYTDGLISKEEFTIQSKNLSEYYWENFL